MSIGIEISTVAIAMVNFERLCMKSLVTKYNRRLSMAVSLMLAVKFNETVYENYHGVLNALLSFFDREWDLPKKQVFEAEFGAFVHLGFTMHLPFPHVYLMYTRLLKLLNQTSKQYLGETMNDLYVQDIIAQERLREQARNLQQTRERERLESRLRAGSVDSAGAANYTAAVASNVAEESTRRPKGAKQRGGSTATVASATPAETTIVTTAAESEEKEGGSVPAKAGLSIVSLEATGGQDVAAVAPPSAITPSNFVGGLMEKFSFFDAR